MAIRPFLFTDTVALAANGASTARLPVSNGETARFRALRFVATGAFNITAIRDDNSLPYTNASADDPITSTIIQNSATANRSADGFDLNLELKGPNALNLELTDTSGSTNTVRILAIGDKEF